MQLTLDFSPGFSVQVVQRDPQPGPDIPAKRDADGPVRYYVLLLRLSLFFHYVIETRFYVSKTDITNLKYITVIIHNKLTTKG